MKISTITDQQSGHWYDKTGKSVYTVIGKNGLERPTTLRDARVMGLVPSVTTIIKCAAAPGLENWKATQLMMSALTLPRLQGEIESEWINRVGTDSKETGRKAAQRGTAVHAALENYYQGKGDYSEYKQHVDATAQAIEVWTDFKGVWQPEKTFAHKFGFGGKTDLIGGESVLVDFKTKEFAPQDKLVTYDEHSMQLASYRQGLGIPNARCAIAYVSVSTPGLVRIMEIPEVELAAGWKMFLGLMGYWNAKHDYYPGL